MGDHCPARGRVSLELARARLPASTNGPVWGVFWWGGSLANPGHWPPQGPTWAKLRRDWPQPRGARIPQWLVNRSTLPSQE